ncbi:MAG TPA: beta-propeller fold lactonase family protein, partial [Chitinophagaceae bacterium]|nr:beta-propeller fold lactonase family protein [Chitinophagaceae bacterium]
LLTFYGCKKDGVDQKLDPSLESISSKKFIPEESNGGAVYVLSNQASGNEVLVYNRSLNGSLSAAGSFSTTGNGTGAGLGSQGSVILHDLEGYSYLIAVNAGSNDITVFRVDGPGLTQIDKVSSHGTTPISVTAHENLVYVLNAGGSGNISGFRLTQDGRLSDLQNSTRALSDDNAGPAQIQFNNDGTQLVVTEKNTNRISTYSVDDHGNPGNAISHSAVGITPFGFDFDNHNDLIVTDAFGGAAAQSAVTSFNLSNTGNLSLVDGPKGTNQTSACWLAITNNGRYCYATNTGSASITGYSIHDGALTLLNADGVTAVTGTTPIDVSLSRNSKFLYNVNSSSHSITFFRVNEDGSLNAIGNVNGLPQGAGGIAAR